MPIKKLNMQPKVLKKEIKEQHFLHMCFMFVAVNNTVL